jgi:hypothetical protein
MSERPFEKTVEVGPDVQEEMAYKLAPALQGAMAAAGPYTTLLNAHGALADPSNKLRVSAPELGPMGAAKAGLIIIISS